MATTSLRHQPLAPIFRIDCNSSYFNVNNHGDQQSNSSSYLEKRQLFLRSYQFSRKKSLGERIKASLVKVRRIIWLKLRSARRLRRVIWWRLRSALRCYQYNRRRRRFSAGRFLLYHSNKTYGDSFPYQYYFLNGRSNSSSSSSSWFR